MSLSVYAIRRARRPQHALRFLIADNDFLLFSVLPSAFGVLHPFLLATMFVSRASLCSRSWRRWSLSRARCFHGINSSSQSKFLKVSEEVRDAVATGKPVVALETTIYTHGKRVKIIL